MNKFMRFYRFMLHTKSHMALYSVSIICIGGALDYFCGIYEMNTWMLFQKIIVMFVIAFAEAILFPEGKEIEKPALIKRSVLWVVLCNGILFGAAWNFDWFADRPDWYYMMLVLFLELALFLMWIGVFVAEDLDSKSLNRGLKELQK